MMLVFSRLPPTYRYVAPTNTQIVQELQHQEQHTHHDSRVAPHHDSSLLMQPLKPGHHEYAWGSTTMPLNHHPHGTQKGQVDQHEWDDKVAATTAAAAALPERESLEGLVKAGIKESAVLETTSASLDSSPLMSPVAAAASEDVDDPAVASDDSEHKPEDG